MCGATPCAQPMNKDWSLRAAWPDELINAEELAARARSIGRECLQLSGPSQVDGYRVLDELHGDDASTGRTAEQLDPCSGLPARRSYGWC